MQRSILNQNSRQYPDIVNNLGFNIVSIDYYENGGALKSLHFDYLISLRPSSHWALTTWVFEASNSLEI